MICKALFASILVLLGHHGLNRAKTSWLYPDTSTSEKENVIIKVEPAEFLRSGPVHGSVIVHGTSSFADESAFKMRLVQLLKQEEKSLHQLKVDHIKVSQPMTMPKLVSKAEYIPNSHAQFVPHQTHFDFSTAFDHSRGISRKAVQDALGRLVDGHHMWVEPHTSFARSLQSQNGGAQLGLEKACEAQCSDYMFHFCSNCSPGATTQSYESAACTCYYAKYEFYMNLLSNPIWAIIMCITGCLVSKNIQAEPRLEQISNGGDFDGICNCFQDTNSCLMGWCCPAVRAANTYHVASIGEFLPMLFFVATLYAIPWFGTFLVFIVLCVKRGQLRQKGNLQNDCCMDCLCTFFCAECVICQEARFVDMAKKGGCAAATVIGQPVEINNQVSKA